MTADTNFQSAVLRQLSTIADTSRDNSNRVSLMEASQEQMTQSLTRLFDKMSKLTDLYGALNEQNIRLEKEFYHSIRSVQQAQVALEVRQEQHENQQDDLKELFHTFDKTIASFTVKFDFLPDDIKTLKAKIAETEAALGKLDLKVQDHIDDVNKEAAQRDKRFDRNWGLIKTIIPWIVAISMMAGTISYLIKTKGIVS